MAHKLVIHFEPDDWAELGIPAYAGAQSIQGISRSFTLINHYLVTGEIRRRTPFSEKIGLYWEPPERGSLDIIFSIDIEDIGVMFGGLVDINITITSITDLFRLILSRVIGDDPVPQEEAIRQIEEIRPGDIDAFVDAVEPATKHGHTVIGQGAKDIVIVQGDNYVVNFNPVSKNYINKSIFSDDEEIMDMSVGSLNVNTGYGRVFIEELGKTVPFSVSNRPDRGTKTALAYSIDRYANEEASNVQVRFRRVLSLDGRTKNPHFPSIVDIQCGEKAILL